MEVVYTASVVNLQLGGHEWLHNNKAIKLDDAE
jgi:hypothetical protein